MAPKVQVPCDFGREYINAPEHSNLKLGLKNGEDYLVNSVIMSYNSPEIKRLTTDLLQSTLDMEDFKVEAVHCFVDALYSGELETINRDIFTNVYKMAHVFKVSWLLGKCTQYFGELLKNRAASGDRYDASCHDELQLLFGIAFYVKDTMKEHIGLMNLFIEHVKDMGDERNFILKLIGESSSDNLSIPKIDILMDLAEKNSNFIVEALVESLKCYPLSSPLTDELIYVLEKCDLASCHKSNPEIYDEFFDILENTESLSKDFKMISRLHRQNLILSTTHSVAKAQVSLPVVDDEKICNLFNSYDECFPHGGTNSVDKLLEIVGSSSKVKNIQYMLFDALFYRSIHLISPGEVDWHCVNIESFKEKLGKIKAKSKQ